MYDLVASIRLLVSYLAVFPSCAVSGARHFNLVLLASIMPVLLLLAILIFLTSYKTFVVLSGCYAATAFITTV